MAAKIGIEETKEVLIALDEISLLILGQIKDGIQLSDVVSIITKVLASEELKSALSRAVVGISNIPAELKDIDLSEGIELIKTEIAYVPKFLEALKK